MSEGGGTSARAGGGLLEVWLRALDGPADLRVAFDEAALLARRAARADVGLVTLVDADEQRFLGSSGLPARHDDLTRTPLTHSFCQHVVSTGDTFLVTDSRRDPRITPEAGGGAVLDLGVVAYLGVPLRDDDSNVVGAVCAFSSAPRGWDGTAVDALRAVAAGVVTEGRVRARDAALQQSLLVRSAIVETALDGLLVMDLAGTVREFNPAAEAMFGRRRQDVVGEEMAELLVPEDLRARHRAGVARFAAGGGGSMLGARTPTFALRADGTRFPVELTLTTTRTRRHDARTSSTSRAHDDPAGAPGAAGRSTEELLVAHVRDRTEEVAAEHRREVAAEQRRVAAARLAASEQQMRLLLDSVPTVLLAVDGDETVTTLTGAGLTALGIAGGSVVGRRASVFLEPRPDLLRQLRQALAGQDVEGTVEVRGRVLRTSIRPVRDQNGRPSGAVCVASDITVDVDREDRLRELADRDQLTGLLNRRAAEAALRPLLLGAAPAVVMIVDLDHFKDVNDSLGHAVGDRLLAAICARVADRLPAGAVFGRLGGDELLVGCRLTGPDVRPVAERLAAQILAAVAEPVTLPGLADEDPAGGCIELVVTASIGLVCTPEQGTDLATVVARADAAMYAAKRRSRGTSACYSPAVDTAPRRLSLTGRLRRAISTECIDVHFQPVFDLTTLSTTGFEALARWTDPDLGPVNPQEFAALAEDTGLIAPLTDLVLDRALAAASGWACARAEAGIPGRAPHVGVNIATVQLRDPGLPGRVAAAAAAYGVPASRLVLELTEGAAMGERTTTDGVLRGLRDRDLKTVIDDFGVGYSNLARLRDLSSDRLVTGVKLDRSFVTDLPGPRATSLVEAFLHLSTTLGLTALAEGIETHEQLGTLRRLGCQQGQGWLVARAMPAHEAVRWVVTGSSHPAPLA